MRLVGISRKLLCRLLRCGKQLFGLWDLRERRSRTQLRTCSVKLADGHRTVGMQVEADSDDNVPALEDNDSGDEGGTEAAGKKLDIDSDSDDEEAKVKPDKEKDHTQKRGIEGDGGDRCRITVELQQKLSIGLIPHLSLLLGMPKPCSSSLDSTLH